MCGMRHEAEHKASDVVAFSSLLQRIGQKRPHEQSHTHVIRVGALLIERSYLICTTESRLQAVRWSWLRLKP
jgi:hypothetical protein